MVERRVSSVVRSRKRYTVPRMLTCNAYKQLYQNSTNNGRTGSLLTSASTGSNLKTVYNISKGVKRVRRGFARLASGKQGVAYLGYMDKKCTKPIAIKVSPFDLTVAPPKRQPAETEFENIQKVFRVAPQHVQAQYGAFRCVGFVPTADFTDRQSSVFDYANQYVTFGEYYHGGSLSDWLKKMFFKLKDQDIALMIGQILKTIARIQKKYPGFRHNDLHLGNVFVDDLVKGPRLAIADFGLAILRPTGTNVIVDRGEFKSSGIGPKTDKRFDVHFFLTSLSAELRPYMARFPKTASFLDRALPVGYRMPDDKYTHEWRLKYNLESYPGLPTITQLLADPYLAGVRNVYSPVRTLTPPRFIQAPRFVPTSAELESMRRRLRKTETLSDSRDAANIAARALSNMAGVSVAKMSAKDFLRLSPRSRTTFKVKTGRPSPTRLPFKATAGIRIRTNVGAGVARPASGPRLSPRVYKNSRFNAMVVSRLKNNNRPFNNRWSEARNSVIANLKNRLRSGKPAFSPLPTSTSPKPTGRFHAVPRNIRANLKMSQTPGGRIKLLGKSGRVVYAEGSAVNKNYLINLARKYKVSLNNAKTKKDISRKLWGASKGKAKL